ncbi:hypothetical protein BH18VER1_BH18VER1_02150 [soil metagenome]
MANTSVLIVDDEPDLLGNAFAQLAEGRLLYRLIGVEWCGLGLRKRGRNFPPS